MAQTSARRPSIAKGRRYIGSEIVFNIIILLCVLMCIIPVIHVTALSFSGRNAVMADKVFLIPRDLDFTAYQSVFLDASMIRSLIFSIVLTVGYTAFAMFCSILLAYPLSRKDLPGQRWMMVFILIPMYFTGGTIANYLWVKQMGLIDSPWSLIWPILISTYNVIIMRNFFSSIPVSLEESARLDGCNDFQTLIKIVLPLSTASLATIALFYAVSRWNSFADVRYYINSTKYQVVFNSTDTQVAAVEGGKNAVLSETIKAAAIVFSTVPIIIVYPFLQKYFVQGVMIGAVKE